MLESINNIFSPIPPQVIFGVTSVLDWIGNVFGPRALQVVIGVTGIYYALIALARVRELYFAGKATSTAARKNYLEELKLEAEIAALRKTAGLSSLAAHEMVPPVAAKRVPLLTRVATFLWSRGPIAQALLVALTALFQLFGALAVALLILAIRFWIIMRLRDSAFHLSPTDTYALVAALLIGGGTLYLGFFGFGRFLRIHLRRSYRYVCGAVLALVFIATVSSWIDQDKQLYAPTGERSDDQ